jgi:hypothetical protein
MNRSRFAFLLSLALSASFALGQSNQGPTNMPQLNTDLYVGAVPGWYPSIALAIHQGCLMAGSRVIIPAGSTPTDTIVAQTVGCTTTSIEDRRVIPVQPYTWSGSAFVATSTGGGANPGGSQGQVQVHGSGDTLAANEGFAYDYEDTLNATIGGINAIFNTAVYDTDGDNGLANLEANADICTQWHSGLNGYAPYGCTIAFAGTSFTSEQGGDNTSLENLHVIDYRNGAQGDSYINYGANTDLENGSRNAWSPYCIMNDEPINSAQSTSCTNVTDMLSSPGTYFGSPWQVHSAETMSAFVYARAIAQGHSGTFTKTSIGDSGYDYGYDHVRLGARATSDEDEQMFSRQGDELFPPQGAISAIASDTDMTLTFTANGGNMGDGEFLICLDVTCKMASGHMLSSTQPDQATLPSLMTTSDSHAVSTSVGIIASDYFTGYPLPSRNQPTKFPAVVTVQIGSAFVDGPVGIGAVNYPENGALSNDAGTPPSWAANTAYAQYAIIFDGTNYQEAVEGGTSNGSAPTFATVVGNQSSDGGVTWQCIALGTGSYYVNIAATMIHYRGSRIGQGGMQGTYLIPNQGYADATTGYSYPAIFVVDSPTATSFEYVEEYKGAQQGQPQWNIGQPNGIGITSISRDGTGLVTLQTDGGYAGLNNLIPRDGQTITVSGITSTSSSFNCTDCAITNLKAFNSGGSYTYQQAGPVDSGSGAGTGGTLYFGPNDTYQLRCGAEVTRVFTSGQYPNGHINVEPNACPWTVGMNFEEPNFYAQTFNTGRFSFFAFTPPTIQVSGGLTPGLQGEAFTAASQICMNCESQDSLASEAGYGGDIVGHNGIRSLDFHYGFLDEAYGPVSNGGGVGYFAHVGLIPQDGSGHAPWTGYNLFVLDNLDAVDGTQVNSTVVSYDTVSHIANFSLGGEATWEADQLASQSLDIQNISFNPRSHYNTYMQMNGDIVDLSYTQFVNGIAGHGFDMSAPLQLAEILTPIVHSGGTTPAINGIYEIGAGATGSGTVCYQAAGITTAGHTISSGINCTTTAPPTLGSDPSADTQLFVKIPSLADPAINGGTGWGNQSISYWRVSNTIGLTNGLIPECTALNVTTGGCTDTGGAGDSSTPPTTDTSGSAYIGGDISATGTIDATGGFSGASNDDWAIANSGSGYTNETFNGSNVNGSRLGFVAGDSTTGDPDFYLDVPTGGAWKFRVDNGLVCSVSATDFDCSGLAGTFDTLSVGGTDVTPAITLIENVTSSTLTANQACITWTSSTWTGLTNGMVISSSFETVPPTGWVGGIPAYSTDNGGSAFGQICNFSGVPATLGNITLNLSAH